MPGLAPTPKKTALVQFEWLALHHVGQWTYLQIARRYGNAKGYPDIAEISKAITRTAKLVGLTLRAGRGRKLGPTT
jgi:hypothetical protein